jgi:hypothetical protein
VLCRRFPRTAVSNFELREHPGQENFAVTLDHLRNPQAFNDIRSDANDGHAGLPF